MNPRKFSIFLIDILILYLCLIITLIIGFGQNLNQLVFKQHIIPFSFLYVIWILIFIFFGLYELKPLRNNSYLIARTTVAIIFCGSISILFFYLTPTITPKTNLLILSLLVWLFIIIHRKIFVIIFSSHFRTKISFLEHSKEINELKNCIIKYPQLGFQVDNENPDIIILEDLKNYEMLLQNARVLNILQASELILQRIPLDKLTEEWIFQNLNQKDLYDKLKRIFDIILAIIFLIISIPIILIAFTLIKLEDGGPLFYIGDRMGKNKKKIRILKLRTMKQSVTGPSWTEGKQDPRITKVGRLLRFLHIDELPQIMNILTGDISFVGPRPENITNIQFLEKEIPYYHLRLLVRPGAVGWTQVNTVYRNINKQNFSKQEKIENDAEKLERDLYYIKNRSLALDISIFLKSLKLFFK